MQQGLYSEFNNLSSRPFIKYVGGKRWFVNNYGQDFPKLINNYYEPFLGSGAIYFYLKSNNIIKGNSILNDINEDLIITYKEIKGNIDELLNKLQYFKNTKENYYKIRDQKYNTDLEKAARYLFLNRTSFGGIYRVNKQGVFNVPYGNRTYKRLFDFEQLKLASNFLNSKTTITSKSYDETNPIIKEDDFFCLDPPYLSNSSIFNRYNSKPFVESDSELFLDYLIKISNAGAKFILFIGDNSDYANKVGQLGTVSIIQRNNNLSFGKHNSIKNEIIIKNY